MPISNARHARARTIATVVAVAVCMLILPTVAHASHVGTVSITPAIGTVVADVCGPFLVQTRGGSDPIGAVVDVEVVGTTPVEFCLPTTGVNPVLIDPTTGDLGGGSDGAIGGEATADASPCRGRETSPSASSRRLQGRSTSRSSWRSRSARTTTTTPTRASPRTPPR